jgi:hypothetical protein
MAGRAESVGDRRKVSDLVVGEHEIGGGVLLELRQALGAGMATTFG